MAKKSKGGKGKRNSQGKKRASQGATGDTRSAPDEPAALSPAPASDTLSNCSVRASRASSSSGTSSSTDSLGPKPSATSLMSAFSIAHLTTGRRGAGIACMEVEPAQRRRVNPLEPSTSTDIPSVDARQSCPPVPSTSRPPRSPAHPLSPHAAIRRRTRMPAQTAAGRHSSINAHVAAGRVHVSTTVHMSPTRGQTTSVNIQLPPRETLTSLWLPQGLKVSSVPSLEAQRYPLRSRKPQQPAEPEQRDTLRPDPVHAHAPSLPPPSAGQPVAVPHMGPHTQTQGGSGGSGDSGRGGKANGKKTR